MEIRVNGEVAWMQAWAGASLPQIVAAVRHWAEKAGRTVCTLLLDGEEVSQADLAEKGRGGPSAHSLLEIRTLDRSQVNAYALHRAAELLPGLRLDLAMAARSLREGEMKAGLNSLFRAVSTLGSLEGAVSTIGALPGTAGEGGPDPEPALSALRELIGKIHRSMKAQDLDAVATAVADEGEGVVDQCDALFRRLIEAEGPGGDG